MPSYFMHNLFDESFKALKKYCESEQYKGWDPFDGLSSRFFQSLPFVKNNRFCKLAWIQLFKRSPINFRKVAGVKKEYNNKGLALFLTSYCNIYEKEATKSTLDVINELCEKLIAGKANYEHSCWGYYFDWQARAFFQPAHTPTVVATSFVADALHKAYKITGNELYKSEVISAAKFVTHNLHRTIDEDGSLAFSYSPLDKTAVFNASLLGARLLAQAFHLTGIEEYKVLSRKAVNYACKHQQDDGAWAYGTLPFHQWIDSFHTGFNLECIYEFQQYTNDESFKGNIEKGLQYYVTHFFTSEGIPKYYNDRTFPVDVHATAQLIVTLKRLNKFDENRLLAEKVLQWTIVNMQHKSGYFYYQKNKNFTNKIAYMRWSQAWMMYAFSFYNT